MDLIVQQEPRFKPLLSSLGEFTLDELRQLSRDDLLTIFPNEPRLRGLVVLLYKQLHSVTPTRPSIFESISNKLFVERLDLMKRYKNYRSTDILDISNGVVVSNEWSFLANTTFEIGGKIKNRLNFDSVKKKVKESLNKIKVVNLSNNNIDDSIILKDILETIIENQNSLEMLDLSYNLFGVSSWEYVAKLLDYYVVNIVGNSLVTLPNIGFMNLTQSQLLNLIWIPEKFVDLQGWTSLLPNTRKSDEWIAVITEIHRAFYNRQIEGSN